MRGITAAILGLGLLVLPITSAHAQTTVQPGSTVIVPAPSASPSTVVTTPGPGGTTVVAPPGSTITVQPPATTTAVAVPVRPWCGGAYATPGGSNFSSCPSAVIAR
jgi:hypothetical protein